MTCRTFITVHRLLDLFLLLRLLLLFGLPPVFIYMKNITLNVNFVKIIIRVIGSKTRVSYKSRPRSMYQYSCMASRLEIKRLYLGLFSLYPSLFWKSTYRVNLKKITSLTRKPRSHVKILTYWGWPIETERYCWHMHVRHFKQ